jgi:hypothetical protein
MTRSLRITFLPTAALLALLIGLCATSARAAYAPGCINPADSALNEYCDSIPSSIGPQTPLPGTPTLTKSLPAREVRQLERASEKVQARRKLLALPQASGQRPVGGPPAAGDSSGLPAWLIVLLAVLAAMLVAAAADRRRSRQPVPPSPGGVSV